jgi:hypothetical protein
MVTVFAPTGEAIAAVGSAPARDLVRAHVARGRLEAEARPRDPSSAGARPADGQHITTLDGGALRVAVRNGWALYVVDRVLRPADDRADRAVPACSRRAGRSRARCTSRRPAGIGPVPSVTVAPVTRPTAPQPGTWATHRRPATSNLRTLKTSGT